MLVNFWDVFASITVAPTKCLSFNLKLYLCHFFGLARATNGTVNCDIHTGYHTINIFTSVIHASCIDDLFFFIFRILNYM